MDWLQDKALKGNNNGQEDFFDCGTLPLIILDTPMIAQMIITIMIIINMGRSINM